MNLPEPSGSSPPLNPPGNIIICALSIASVKLSIDSAMCDGLRFVNILTSASAPARSNAFAESYSQFVPGKAGINTRGFAKVVLGRILILSPYSNFFIPAFSHSAFVAKTPSSGTVHAFSISSSGIFSPHILMHGSAIV